jgi:hypothetical protein
VRHADKGRSAHFFLPLLQSNLTKRTEVEHIFSQLLKNSSGVFFPQLVACDAGSTRQQTIDGFKGAQKGYR